MDEDSKDFQQFQHEILVKMGFWKLHQEDQLKALHEMETVAEKFIQKLQQK